MKRLTGAAFIAALSLMVAVLEPHQAGAAGGPAAADVSNFLANAPASSSLLVQPEQGREAQVAAALRAAGWHLQSVDAGLITVAAGSDPAPDVRRIEQVPGVQAASTPAVAVNTADGPAAPAATISQVTGEGAVALGAPEWHAAGITGKHTRLAVIDTGFSGWTAAAAAGRVPSMTFDPSRDVDLCTGGFEQTSHGTATAEVIHDVAPDAELVRVCINDAAGLARAIPRLIAQHVEVVNMSVGFYNTARGDGQGGPLSPDSSVRQAVGAGILWVNSSGNEAQLHWAGPFSDAGTGEHQWQPGRTSMAFTLPPKSPVTVYLKWDEWNAPVDDYSLCVALAPTDEPTCYASDVATRRTPTASIGLTNPYDQPVTLYASVKRKTGGGNPRLDAFFVGAGTLEFPVPQSSLAEPAAVDGVVAVGAECAVTRLVQSYSSRGPTLDGRPGITVVAPSAASSFVFGPARGCEGGYAGTSVSSPHVAGALALLHELMPAADSTQLVEQLRDRAGAPPVPGTPRPDTAYGYGVLALGPPVPTGGPGEPSLAGAHFDAYASGGEQVPPTDSPAWSWAEFTVGPDATTLQYSARVFGLRDPSGAELLLGAPDEPGLPVARLNVPGEPGSSGCVEVASYTIIDEPAPWSSGSDAATQCPSFTADGGSSDALCSDLNLSPPPAPTDGDSGRRSGYCGFADVSGTVTSADLQGPLAGHPISELIDLIRQGKVSLNFSNGAFPGGAIRGQLIESTDDEAGQGAAMDAAVTGPDQAVLGSQTRRTSGRRRPR